MIIRQLNQHEYDALYHSFLHRARVEPLDASYSVSIKVNGEEYIIKAQLEEDCRIAVLQAIRIGREEEGHTFELITENGLLSAFLEIMLYQRV